MASPETIEGLVDEIEANRGERFRRQEVIASFIMDFLASFVVRTQRVVDE